MTVDFDEFQLALEGFDAFGGDVAGHFLDTETGEVLTLCRDWDDYDELSSRLDAGLGDRYLRIQPLESRESFDIMKRFAEAVEESRVQRRLLEALAGNKPFRRFKEIVHSDLALRDQWFSFRDDAHEQHLRQWLENKGIEAEIRRRPN